ncbi:hypothetical protein, partial [Klebsiella pneumoniae]|uniref:hypothetical protein n=1 Tax=Klebsiella pneumoniae TaxID=573 RepID=UPI001C8B1DB8
MGGEKVEGNGGEVVGVIVREGKGFGVVGIVRGDFFVGGFIFLVMRKWRKRLSGWVRSLGV